MPNKSKLVDASLFQAPTAEYRPSPFWSVNADLSGAEQRWQVRQMKKAGMGGFFYHSRAGLVTKYLSEKWFKLVGECVDEARKLKMEAWLYDEDQWPSGFAGGLLLDRHPEFRMREVYFGRGDTVAEARTAAEAMVDSGMPAQMDFARERFEPLANFAIRGAGKGLYAYRPLAPGKSPGKGEKAVCFLLHFSSDRNWTGGHSYTDLMDPECVREFINMTHAEYVKRFKRDLGKAVPGIFTDEPNNHNWFTALPWSRGFERDLAGAVRGGINRLPALVLPTADSAEVRFGFMKAISERWVSSFTKQIGDYCAKAGFSLTGHFLDEDSLKGNCKYSGGVMPNYEHMQVPGIDHLLRSAGARLVHKQVSSVARQMGKKRVLSELFGVSGHSMTFEDYKWIGDWHLVNGVNLFVPHLTLQTMAGMRKRDFPPTISWHQPWWPDLSDLNDYFSRVAVAMRQGRAIADILVLHPIESAWLVHEWDEKGDFEWGGRKTPKMTALDQGLNLVMDALAEAQRDFDLGDGTIMSRHARIAGKTLKVGKGGIYRAVVVPPSTNWRESTVQLLEKWAANGGAIVFAGMIPEMLDGKPALARWKRLLSRKSVVKAEPDAQSIEKALASLAVARDLDISVNGSKYDDEVVYEHRQEGGEHTLFLINRSRTGTKNVEVNLPFHAEVFRLDPFSGGQAPQVVMRAQKTGFTLELPPVGSALFRMDERGESRARVHPTKGKTAPLRLGKPLAVSPDRPNILVLDRCRFKVNGTGVSQLHPVFEARKAAFDAAGLKDFEGLQPWRMRHLGVNPTKTAKVEMVFPFRIEADRVPDLELVLETPECYEVTLNGKKVRTDNSGRWLQDPGLRCVRLGNLAKKGDNELTLAGVYGLAMEIEDLFLLGKFTVKGPVEGPMVIDDYAEPAGVGDWTRSGFRFFAGAMNYRFRVDVPEAGRWRIRLGKASGAVFRVRVDGKGRGRIWCAPWEADLGRLTRGKHTVEIEVVSTLQNTFGPLHAKWYEEKGYCWWIGPESFSKDQLERYHIHPYGLLESPTLLKTG